MKTKLSLITLFTCVLAGTSLFADNEVYDGQTIEFGDFIEGDLANSSWADAMIGTTMVYFMGANLTGANFNGATIDSADFYSVPSVYGTTILKNAIFTNATIGSTSEFIVAFSGADLTGRTSAKRQ